VIRARPVQTRFSDSLSDADIERIREQRLDVCVRLGFRILKGRVLDCANFGVWSFHHGDNQVNRGGPADSGKYSWASRRPARCFRFSARTSTTARSWPGRGPRRIRCPFTATAVILLENAALLPRQLELFTAAARTVSGASQGSERASSLLCGSPLQGSRQPGISSADARHIGRYVRLRLDRELVSRPVASALSARPVARPRFLGASRSLNLRKTGSGPTLTSIIGREALCVYRGIRLRRKEGPHQRDLRGRKGPGVGGSAGSGTPLPSLQAHSSSPAARSFISSPSRCLSATVELYRCVRFPDRWELQERS